MSLEDARFITFDAATRGVGKRQRPERFAELESIPHDTPLIARGGGYSYAPASFGAGARVIDMGRFDRILAFDEDLGIMTVEAGASIGAVMDFVLARGWSLPAAPGYPAITIGGCVAADVHGKNPLRDGNFSRWVKEIELFTPRGGVETVSRTEQPELFAMTCGGYGLSGLILDVTVRLLRQPSTNVHLAYTPVASFAAGVDALRHAREADLCYSAHDPFARGAHAGRGFLCIGGAAHGRSAAPRYKLISAASRASSSRRWNSPGLKLANIALTLDKRLRPTRNHHILAATFPFAITPTYHLWFGRDGFIEAQYLIAWDRAAAFAAESVARAEQCGATLALISMKGFSAQASALALSGEGALFAVNSLRDREGLAFAAALHQLAAEYGAEPYLSKDGSVPPKLARATLPHFEDFARALGARREAGHNFRSALSQHLDL